MNSTLEAVALAIVTTAFAWALYELYRLWRKIR